MHASRRMCMLVGAICTCACDCVSCTSRDQSSQVTHKHKRLHSQLTAHTQATSFTAQSSPYPPDLSLCVLLGEIENEILEECGGFGSGWACGSACACLGWHGMCTYTHMHLHAYMCTDHVHLHAYVCTDHVHLHAYVCTDHVHLHACVH